MPLPSQANTLGALQALQAIIINETLVGGVSPFAALSTGDAARYGVARAVFVGRPKDFADAALPCCALWLPERDEAEQPVELVGYAGRVLDDLEVTVQVFCDLRADWWAAEQKILQIRDALWPVLLHHLMLGASVPTVSEADAWEGRGLCYEQIAGVEYRCYEAQVGIRQQYTITGGAEQ